MYHWFKTCRPTCKLEVLDSQTEFHWFTKPKLSMPTRFSNSQGISCKHTCSFLLPDLDEQTSVTPSTPFPWLPASTNWGGASALLQSGVGINKICRLPQHAISKLSVFLLITFRSIMALPIYAFTCLAWLWQYNASKYVYSHQFAVYFYSL